jgi:hypothetical protein
VDILRSNLECQVDLAVYSTKTEQVRSALSPLLCFLMICAEARGIRRETNTHTLLLLRFLRTTEVKLTPSLQWGGNGIVGMIV